MDRTLLIRMDELNPYVRKAGKQYRASWKNRSRRIYDHEFLYCEKGSAHIHIDDQKHDITPGTLVLVKPDRPHSFWFDEGESAEIIWVHFDYIFRDDVYSLNELVTKDNSILFSGMLPERYYIRPEPVFENMYVFPEILKFDENSPEEIFMRQTFREILSSFEEHGEYWQLDCKILLLKVLKTVMSLESQNGSMAFARNKRQAPGTVVESVVKYVVENLHRKISIGEISRIAALNEDYLGKLFKRETGENLSVFVNRLRLSRAKDLLKNSSLCIADIAEATGFTDECYFSNVMKRYEGYSPSEWRRRMRGHIALYR